MNPYQKLQSYLNSKGGSANAQDVVRDIYVYSSERRRRRVRRTAIALTAGGIVIVIAIAMIIASRGGF